MWLVFGHRIVVVRFCKSVSAKCCLSSSISAPWLKSAPHQIHSSFS